MRGLKSYHVRKSVPWSINWSIMAYSDTYINRRIWTYTFVFVHGFRSTIGHQCFIDIGYVCTSFTCIIKWQVTSVRLTWLLKKFIALITRTWFLPYIYIYIYIVADTTTVIVDGTTRFQSRSHHRSLLTIVPISKGLHGLMNIIHIKSDPDGNAWNRWKSKFLNLPKT